MNRVNRLIAIILSGIILFTVITTLSITANAASYFNGAYGDDFLSTESNSPMLKVTGSEFSNSETLAIDSLINEGYSIKNDSDANAFTWIVKVLKLIEKYPDSVVYSDIKSEANEAKSRSSISTFNCKNKVLGYLSILKDEIIESHPKINTTQGDIDRDGEITVVDSTFMQRYLIGVQTPYPIGKVIE